MSKTFWSVTYTSVGAFGLSEAWFDSLGAARSFQYTHNYADNPMRHTYRSPNSISWAERLVKHTMEVFDGEF